MKIGTFVLFVALFFAPSLLAAKPSNETDPLNRALSQLNQAISQAEASLGPHQPGSGWTKQHMKKIAAMVNGTDGGTGGIIKNLREGREDTKGAPREALDHVLIYLKEAADHAERSVAARGIDETHAEARLAAAMLVAARGSEHAEGPVTGGLAFAVTQAAAGAAK